jgi:L-rhamnose isomerase/sugar isomerase
LVDQKKLKDAQMNNDVVLCQEILQEAYRTDVRPLVAQARINSGGTKNPLQAYRKFEIRKTLIKERGTYTLATGL